MLGMLHNIAELIAIKTPATEAKQYYLNHQADIAAELVTAWGLGPMAADAMRYQQALPAELRDAGHLVKLISLSTRLALSDAAGIAAAGTVFGLSEELTREINRRIGDEVSTIAGTMGIPLDDEYRADNALKTLKQAILNQAIVNESLALSDLSGPIETILAETVNSLTLVTGFPALCFGHRADALVLLSGSGGDMVDLTVSAEPGGSVLTEAFHRGQPVFLGDRPATVLDRQLMALLHTPSLLAIPVRVGNRRPGVFALGTDRSDQTTTIELASLFCQRLATALQTATRDTDDLQDDVAREQLRRKIHEVSNPLTIVRQYIYQLRDRLDDNNVVQELDVVRDELDRASHLLVQMSQAETRPSDGPTVSVNDELESLARILDDTLFNDGNRELELRLCPSASDVVGSASAVRQVVINLVRNATEALSERGGKVVLATAFPVYQNHGTWVELEVSDTGPGLPEAVKNQLFEPVNTTKGEDHSGLGLSIVKQLIDDMEGIIACRTGPTGTTFRILLPAATHKKNDND